jgi:hypothetical protein
MQAKLTPTTRLDDLDARRFKEMIDSAPFQLLWDRVAIERVRAGITCERGEGLVELRRAQGAAKALRTVLGLPEVLLSEMKAKVSKGGV